MIRLKEIPRTYEAVQFDGEDIETVQKFCSRHGAQVEFQTNDDDVTTGLLHTPEGTLRIRKSNYVLASDTDQVTAVAKSFIEDPAMARYEILPDEEPVAETVE